MHFLPAQLLNCWPFDMCFFCCRCCRQVAKATEQQRLNQQRMTLSLNHFGAIIGVNSGGCPVRTTSLLARSLSPTYHHLRAVRVAGVPKSLFGFDGTQLVGRPLSSVIDIFKDFQKAGAGDELSLQELLVAQMLASTDPAANISPGTACASWRVGVQQPSTDGDSTTVSWHRGVSARECGLHSARERRGCGQTW